MPLTTCPDCGRRVSTSAEACIQCGRPMRGGQNGRVAERSPHRSAPGGISYKELTLEEDRFFWTTQPLSYRDVRSLFFVRTRSSHTKRVGGFSDRHVTHTATLKIYLLGTEKPLALRAGHGQSAAAQILTLASGPFSTVGAVARWGSSKIANSVAGGKPKQLCDQLSSAYEIVARKSFEVRASSYLGLTHK